MSEAPAHPGPKLLSHERLLELRARARQEGRAVVHCHGCFDIVHPGHIRHLRQAKSLGDVLLVSITGDEQVGKGSGRPLIPQELRAENLAALDFVDWVYVEPRPTASGLLEEVRPDVYVKGREYEFNQDPRFADERLAVERHGGRVVFSSGDVVFSSTALINAIESSVDPSHQALVSLLSRDELSGAALFSRVSAFRNQRVVVVGEVITDTYVLCDRPEVASESPVMTLRPLEHRQYDGGAAILARHLAALGAMPVLVTTLPEDGPAGEVADSVRRRLLSEGVEVRSIPQSAPIAEKQRFLVGAQKVMKLDLIEQVVLDASEQDRLVDAAVDASRGAAAAIIADFGLGALTPGVVKRVSRGMRPNVGVLAGDISGRRASLRKMVEMDLLCPSEAELRDAYRLYDEGLPMVAGRMLDETKSRAAIVTMGAEGLISFEHDADEQGEGWESRLRSEHVPTLSAMPVDVLGCGDALIAGATLMLASGGSVASAAFVGSVTASVHAQRIGNVPVSATDLRRAIARLHSSHLTYAEADVIRAVGRPSGIVA